MPCFSTTCNIEITSIRRFAQAKGYSFFITMSFVLSRAVNLIPELRHRLIDGELYEFERVDPGFTVLLKDNSFSFCDSIYFESFRKYYDYACRKIESVKARPDCTTGEKHHMFFITNIPWFSFTAFTHPYDKKYGSIPIITLGRYFQQGGEIWIPLGAQVHHGVLDGIHVGIFYDNVRQIACNLEGLDE